MAILSSTEYPAIRAAIDVQLDASSLPDGIIGLDIYIGAADDDVLEIDPTAESRTGDELVLVKRAAIFFAAARLCPAVVRLTSVSAQARDISYARATFDPEQRAEELRNKARETLDQLVDATTDPPSLARRPTMFAVASGRRGL